MTCANAVVNLLIFIAIVVDDIRLHNSLSKVRSSSMITLSLAQRVE